MRRGNGWAQAIGPRRTEGELFAIAARGKGVFTEQFVMSLHGLLHPSHGRFRQARPRISFELAAREREIRFLIWMPAEERPFIESQLRAVYPSLEVTPIDERPLRCAWVGVANVRLAYGSYLPIRTSFETEPLANVLWTLARVPADDEVAVQFLIRPKSSGWQVDALRQAQRLRDGRRGWEALLPGVPAQVTPSQFEKMRAKAIEEKAAGFGFDSFIRVLAAAGNAEAVRDHVRVIAASLAPYVAANAFRVGDIAFDVDSRERFARREFPLFGSFVLTAPELAALWHLPSEGPPQLGMARTQAVPAPHGVESGVRALGLSTWGNEARPVRLSIADSRQHLHLLGSTGTGKTTAMLNLAAQDIAAGRGVGVLDPKGDLVRGLLERIPRERIEDVVLISPDDAARSVGLNPLQLWPGDDPYLVADNALAIFRRIYERFWGPRTDDVLKCALLTLLHRGDATLAHVPLLLSDEAFRGRMLEGLSDPIGLGPFWDEYERLTPSQRAETVGPALNKLRDFLVRPRLRRILCQPHSTFDLREIVDGGKILLADLSVGRWGDTTASLIGSFLVARIWQAILARSSLAEGWRPDFFLFVDEFQHFLGVASSFDSVLAEARSLRLSLTIANQHLGQLSRDLREAVASNARSHLVFQCGQDDAAYLAREFAPIDLTALTSLGRYEAVARLSIGGRTSGTFTLRTLPPCEGGDQARAAETVAASAQRFARPVTDIDRELEAAIGSLPEDPESEGPRRPKQ